MNINPNPAQVAQLQALVASWTSHTTSTSSAPNQPTHAGTDQSNSQASSQPPVTNLYQNPNRHTNIASSGPLSSSVLPSSGHPAPTASNSFHIPLPALATSSGHLAPTSNSFLGHNFNALRPQAVRQAVREANQGRLSSSAEHIPRRPSLQRRGRSRAIHPPALSLPEDSSTRHIQDCVYQDGGIAKVRLDYRIYPEKAMGDVILFQNIGKSVDATLKEFGLYYSDEVAVETPVSTVINLAAAKMEQSELNWHFASSPHHSTIFESERLPLQLLQVHNRGNQVRGVRWLRRYQHAPDMTLLDLMGDRPKFSHPLCLNNGRLIINLIIRCSGSSVMAPLNNAEYSRVHTCIALKFYNMFPTDNVGSISIDDISSDEEVDEAEVRMQLQTRRSPRQLSESQRPDTGIPSSELPSSRQYRPALPSNTPSLQTDTLTPQLRGTLSTSSNTLRRDPSLPILPGILWQVPFIPTPGRYAGMLHSESLLSSEYQPLAEDAYELASDGVRADDLSLEGTSVADLAQTFKKRIGEAIKANDFTSILSPGRNFMIVDSQGATTSLGEGIERETIQVLLDDIRKAGAEYMVPISDGHYTLAMSHTSATARHVSQTRLLSMSIFGALVAICLIRGISPTPLSPLLLHYIVHEHNIHSIDLAILGEWCPTLKATISEWIEVGPQGDASQFQGHFSTYHNIQTACLRDRDQASHDALAVEMLRAATIGPEPHTHPEFNAFIKGFCLPCKNGFDFTVLVRSVQGGSARLLSEIWCSHMDSWARLHSHVQFTEPSLSLRNRLRVVLDNDEATYRTLIENFMGATGVPNRGLFDEAKAHFNAAVDLTLIDEDGYRAKQFCYASTGSYEREMELGKISIRFIDDSDQTYGTLTSRASMLAHGKVCFRTCYQRASLPASYILKLAEQHYPTPEFKNFQDAFDQWFLCEVLNAIGNHTIL